jgi:transcriptional regulator with XRE-family HTH domain
LTLATQGDHAKIEPNGLIRDSLRSLMAERGLSFRRLAEKTRAVDPNGRGLSYGHISNLAKGERPTEPTVRLLAKALELPPETFADYRIARLRASLDEREVGLDQALRTLETLEAALDGRERAELGLNTQ